MTHMTAVSVTDYVFVRAHEHPDRTAIVEVESGRSLTYRQLAERIRLGRARLAEAGARPGDVVALMAPNGIDYPVAFHAVVSLGAVVTTMNPNYTSDELSHQLRDAQASVLLCSPTHVEHAQAAMAGTDVRALIPLPELTDFAATADPGPVTDSTAVAALPYSSGTTGLPKGVMLTHANLVAQLDACAAGAPIEAGEVALAVLPFFHIFGMQVILNNVLAQGGTIVTMRRFDLEPALATVERHRVSHLFVVPPIVLALAQHPAVADYDLSSLRWILSGAAPLGADVAKAAGDRIGCPVRQGYGMTETAGATHLPHPTGGPDTSGVALPGLECRIAGPDGEALPTGGEGEVWLRGGQIMAGYWGHPDATAVTVDPEGWLRTGDIGRVDEHGNLTLIDRIKELFKCNGFQVAPAELEAVLITHPAVRDAAVVGVPDPAAGEVPKAFVVLREGATATAAELVEFLDGRLAGYKRIRHLEFIEAVPRNPSGKILRRELRALPTSVLAPTG
jgi:4-coumarate--CoA ligase